MKNSPCPSHSDGKIGGAVGIFLAVPEGNLLYKRLTSGPEMQLYVARLETNRSEGPQSTGALVFLVLCLPSAFPDIWAMVISVVSGEVSSKDVQEGPA